MKKDALDPSRHWNQLARQFLGDDFFDDITTIAKSSEPDADVYHGKNEVIVVIDLPGMEDIRSIDLRVEEDQLLLKGKFPNPYHGYEVSHTQRVRGSFEMKIPLGVAVSPKYTSARYRKGVLEIRFPKMKQRNSHRLHIDAMN